MAQTRTAVVNRPAWVDLSSSDPTAAGAFYSKLLGWKVEVSPDPQYGGYAMATIDGQDVAGIGPKQSPEAPSAWMLYIGTADATALAAAVREAGGQVIVEPMQVGAQGRMAVFQDPSGAFISGWEPQAMSVFAANKLNTYGWAELNSRGIEKALPFYDRVFGWTAKTSPMGEGMGDYTEFQLEGTSLAGAMEMAPMVPAEVPSYWMIYFNVDDVDAGFRSAIDLGAQELVGPRDFPGGRFTILRDPEGAVFGLLKMRAA